MSGGPASVTTIPAGVPFVDALARGLLDRWGADPLALSEVLLLLPTRRACRSLREAFLRASGGRPLLLPRMLPLGDLDEDELSFGEEAGAFSVDLAPAMPPLRRQLSLTRLIMAARRLHGDAGPDPHEDHAARLADELSRLLDQVETEGLELTALSRLVPADYAEHWQITLAFLEILTTQWPRVQEDEGVIGAAERRRRLIEARTGAWRTAPPGHPVIAAGSTGSIPASAELIATVAGLPLGEVVLPGLDQSADEAAWTAIRNEPTHPQHGLARLLDRLDLSSGDVAVWPWAAASPTSAARSGLLNLALRPAAVSVGPPEARDRESLAAALAGLERIDCAGPGEEAMVIALRLREALEHPGRTAALVTPDRALARRVAAELRRWDIEVDDSAGLPLGETPPGTFLRLTAQLVAGGLAPVDLLAALKHPLARGGLSDGAFRSRVRALEVAVLRGPRPAPGFDGLLGALASGGGSKGLMDWLRGLAALAGPFAAALESGAPDLAEAVAAHIAFAEALAAGADEAGADGDGAARLWAGEAGEAAALFMAELHEVAPVAPGFGGPRYPALLSALVAPRAVRPRYGRHPRLAILGPLEARLQHHDLLILGGLNEGTWPLEVDPGPWLSRPMRVDFGLPAPERRIGLSAHDFVQACGAPRVLLTRSRRVEGTPTVPSRWLLRVEALLEAWGLPGALDGASARWCAWAEGLDRPETVAPMPPPAPRPPVAARPRRLSVTRVETWMRDPYALYAERVLRLSPLDPIDGDPDAAARGTLVHQALEAYLGGHPDAPPADPEAALIAAGEAAFRDIRAWPGLWAFWWPRFRRVAGWFADLDTRRRSDGWRAWPEVRGELMLQGPAGPFQLTATADRIESRPGNGVSIVDYKTGEPPKKKELELGFAPQLPLEAAIALAGGFPDIPAGPLCALEFWRLSGGTPPGKINKVNADAADLAAQALDGLTRLIAQFDDPSTPYLAVPRPDWASRFRDYAHLAREKEWSAGTAGGEADS